jgi:hypothetical protein
MTHDELLAEIDSKIEYCTCEGWGNNCWGKENIPWQALRAVVELHKPSEAWGDTHCGFCFDLAWEPSGLEMDEADFTYPCPTVRAIEKELQ